MNHLLPCSECQRHVRALEPRCPFCDAELDLSHSPAPVLPSRRLGRAALFAFGATLIGATTIGCGDSDESTGTGGAGSEAGGGGSSGSAGATGGTAGEPIAPAYGAVPPDDGGDRPLYGAAPP